MSFLDFAGFPYLPSYFHNDSGIDQGALAKVVRHTLREREIQAGVHRCWRDGVRREWSELTPLCERDAMGLGYANCPSCATTVCRVAGGETEAA